ncbi:mannitol dehydrogenase family protein [Microbacterium trichothecenolyticum]|uniref:mannitol dehydrogenase family protein n=1 Tax=Microbacterium trichothecenolyticum TaxID=69370 RepID=UPI001C6F00F7|nr:mannitol dehydrogenase family protein [Microbacterium trichothecenolyticum]MBW9120464.1 mannitol dehydrogenase family protein [Microbacterium trichothecenolyticum]
MTGHRECGPTRSRPAPPVRIVHLGLGAFSRSHTAWYTTRADNAAHWGIAAYTGRSPGLADALAAQDGVYSLVTRSAAGDSREVVESIVRAHPGDDMASLLADLAAPDTAIVTLTITEAGYRTGLDGLPDEADPLVVADRELLGRIASGDAGAAHGLSTALARLVAGLDARRRAGAGPLALVSCDNLPDNGGHLSRALFGLAASLPETARWCADHVSFVSCSVDRITPRIEPAELARLSEQYRDAAPVVAEDFSDWVISGEFPAGRPAWETAGARFTVDLEPWEARKLWLLNGAHTILACLGSLRGHALVSEAIADPVCRDAVEDFWDDAQRSLPEGLGVPAYREALLGRFANPRIAHLLAQIALDSATKMRLRIVPVAERERAAGRSASGAAGAVAAWLAADGVVGDPPARLAEVSAALADDDEFVAEVARALDGLAGLAC